jgi:glycosyltransferase involved in cell wall biosynthesis
VSGEATRPTVAVAIRAYRRRWLGAAINSVLAQTWRDFVLTIYDDAGDLDDVVAQFSDARIRYLRAPSKREAGGRYCAALELCQAEFVALLDDDDAWAPQFLESTVQALQSNPQAAMVYCRALEQHANGREVHSPLDPSGLQERVAERIFGNRWAVPTSLMLLRRSAITPIIARGEIPDNSAPDVLMSFLLDKHGHRLLHVPIVLCTRQVHGVQQMTRSLEGSGVVLVSLEQMTVDNGELELLRKQAVARRLVIRAMHALRHDQRAQARTDLARASVLFPQKLRVLRMALHIASVLPFAPAAIRHAWALYARLT